MRNTKHTNKEAREGGACLGPLQGHVGATDQYGTGDRVGELGVCTGH
jgi:hypothetical protein